MQSDKYLIEAHEALKLWVVDYLDKVIAVNNRGVNLSRLVFCSWVESFIHKDGDGVEKYMLSSAPYYEITKIEPLHFVHIQTKERIEEGRQYFKLIEATWDDGYTIADKLLENRPVFDKPKLPDDLKYSDRPKRFVRNQKAPEGLLSLEDCEAFKNSL